MNANMTEEIKSLRKQLAEAKAHIEALTPYDFKNCHGATCYYCGEPINSLAGNPSEWPVLFPHKEEPGVSKAHHGKCVFAELAKNKAAREWMIERETCGGCSVHYICANHALKLGEILYSAELRALIQPEEKKDTGSSSHHLFDPYN